MTARAPEGGSNISWVLGPRRRHFVTLRDIAFASQPIFWSVWQTCRCLAHHGDRPPDSEPGEQLLPVAAPKHSVRMCRGLEFGVAPMCVHHQVRGAIDIYVGGHHVSLRDSTQGASEDDVWSK